MAYLYYAVAIGSIFGLMELIIVKIVNYFGGPKKIKLTNK